MISGLLLRALTVSLLFCGQVAALALANIEGLSQFWQTVYVSLAAICAWEGMKLLLRALAAERNSA